MMPNQPILVAGATGRTGQQVVKMLQAQGRAVRALVRDISRARGLLGAYPDLIVGDVTVPATIPATFKDVQLFICTIGSNVVAGKETPEDIDYGGVKVLTDAASDARVQHMVLVSSIGVTNPDHPLNQYGRVMDWKLKGEDYLRQSGIPYTIVRPGGLVDEPGGKGVQFAQGDPISGRITRADVAAVCVHALNNPFAMNKTMEIINHDQPPADFDEAFQQLQTDKS